MNEQDIFLTALERPSPGERRQWIKDACAGNDRLMQRIESLLNRHETAGSFLEKPPPDLDLDTIAAAGGDTRENATHDETSITLTFLAPSAVSGSLGRLGRYEVLSILGRGGMGIVLKGLDTHLNRTVALKVLAPELAASPLARKRFLREAQSAAAIAHPNVVVIHSVEDDKLPYLVMELIDGPSLREKMQQDGFLPLPEIIAIGSQITAGLAAAHRRGLIHRDIKPANVLLASAPSADSALSPTHHSPTHHSPATAKLTDFGLARAADDMDLTNTGEIAGTPQYMSPEQARGDLLDARSDLFSLGSLLFFLCTGRSPFRANNPAAVIHAVCYEPASSIHALNPEIPEWLCQLVGRLLEKNPAHRIQSAQEVADQLQRGAGSAENGIVEPALQPAPARSASGFRPFTLVATALAAFFFVSLGIWVIIRDKDGREKARIQVPEDGTVVIESDSGSKRASAPPVAAFAAQPQAFILLGAATAGDRKFDTLVAAVQASREGDIIEIQGNGPFLSQGPIDLGRQSLTIRAAAGFQPVLKLDPYLRFSGGQVVVEGLSFERLSASRADAAWMESLIRTNGGSVFIANCRFDLNVEGYAACVGGSAGKLRLVNCQLINSRGPALMRSSSREAAISNCLIVSREEAFHWIIMNGALSLEQSTIVTSGPLIAMVTNKTGLANAAAASFTVQSARNVLDVASVFSAWLPPDTKIDETTKTQAGGLTAKLLKWHDERNVFANGACRVSDVVPGGPKNASEWRALWGTSEADATEGVIRFEGGNLVAKTSSGSLAVAPLDFRLRTSSAGYRAGPDGKDLGADIDLVGPGAAYERWKQTPAYQQWISETKQSAASLP